jgi:hypothetical protein
MYREMVYMFYKELYLSISFYFRTKKCQFGIDRTSTAKKNIHSNHKLHHLRKYSSVSRKYFSGAVAKGICEQSHRSRYTEAKLIKYGEDFSTS